MKAQVWWWLLRQKREKWDTGVLLEVELQEHRVSTQCLLALVLYIPQGPTPFPCSSCYRKWQPTAFGNKKKHRQTLHPLLSTIWGSTCIWCLSENPKGEDRAPGLQLSKEGNVQKQPSTTSLGPLREAEEGHEDSSPCLWKKNKCGCCFATERPGFGSTSSYTGIPQAPLLTWSAPAANQHKHHRREQTWI